MSTELRTLRPKDYRGQELCARCGDQEVGGLRLPDLPQRARGPLVGRSVHVTLTKPQKIYVTRATILSVLEDFIPTDPDKAVSADELEAARRLAEEDLEAARIVMEEQAAFNHLMKAQRELYPNASKSQLQKAVRALVADPATREKAAEESGVYAKMGFE